MPLILPGNVAAATAAVGYDVANSCRFDGSSADMTKTSGDGDVDKWTLSMWVKRAGLGATGYMFSAFTDGANYTAVYFESADTLTFLNLAGGENAGRLKTTRIFRDPSAWYHIVAVWDSDNATAGDRLKLYVNGVEETVFGTDENPTQDQNSSNADGEEIVLGQKGDDGAYFSGYLAEVCLIDGLALTPTSFGEFDSDSPTIWKPIDVSGLTFGTNGFYCDFEASANLGNDANGGTDFTETNLDATDQATDTPTNNFCTWNPLDAQGNTFAKGNVTLITVVSGNPYQTATVWLTAGKWYFEIKYTSNTGSNEYQSGLANKIRTSESPIGAGPYNYEYQSETGLIQRDNSTTSYGVTATTGDIIGHFVDLDNNKLYIAKNGTIMNSGTGHTLIAPASTTNGAYTPAANLGNGTKTGTFDGNFGGCPAFAISSGNADAEGYGNFEYDPSDGGSSSFDSAAKNFLAICTKNLAEYGG